MVIENLHVAGMLRNRRLARRIAGVGMAVFAGVFWPRLSGLFGPRL
jgi:hypothetical protein